MERRLCEALHASDLIQRVSKLHFKDLLHPRDRVVEGIAPYHAELCDWRGRDSVAHKRATPKLLAVQRDDNEKRARLLDLVADMV